MVRRLNVKEGYRIAKVYCTLEADPVTGKPCEEALAAYITVGKGNPSLTDPFSCALGSPGPQEKQPQPLKICVFPCPPKDIKFPTCQVNPLNPPTGIAPLLAIIETEINNVANADRFSWVHLLQGLEIGIRREMAESLLLPPPPPWAPGRQPPSVFGQPVPPSVVAMLNSPFWGQGFPFGPIYGPEALQRLLEAAKKLMDKLGCNWDELFPGWASDVPGFLVTGATNENLLNFYQGLLFVLNGFPPHISDQGNYSPGGPPSITGFHEPDLLSLILSTTDTRPFRPHATGIPGVCTPRDGFPPAGIAPPPLPLPLYPIGSTFLADLSSRGFMGPRNDDCQVIETSFGAGVGGSFTVSGPCVAATQNPGMPQGQPFGAGLGSPGVDQGLNKGPHPYHECECLCKIDWTYNKSKSCIGLKCYPDKTAPLYGAPVAKNCRLEIIGTEGVPLALMSNQREIAQPPMISLRRSGNC